MFTVPSNDLLLYDARGWNFRGWSLTLGDGIYACSGYSVSSSDISVRHYRRLSVLYANPRMKPIQSHAILYKKVYVDDLPPNSEYGKVLFISAWRLPYRPRADVNSRWNPQTLEGAVMYYDGDRGVRYVVGLQWIVNPWISNELRYWTSSGWRSWKTKKVNTRWHWVIFWVDFSRKRGLICFDGRCRWVSAVGEDIDWGSRSFYVFQVETISCYPNCDLKKGFKHRAFFKRWYLRIYR